MRGTPDPIATLLLTWFDAHRRDLPWRRTRDAYHVLVSEAMLQQTQVATVIPYFERFLSAFPTVHDLANADEQRVLRLWQGLGYYSRARNLHRAAKSIVSDYAGRVPDTVDALLSLPGVGRYTAGAVASIAYDTRAPILDGNVTRVLCRLDAIDADPRDRAVQQRLWARAEAILPDQRIGDFNQALMELGATVCTPKKPACLLCPVRTLCKAFEKQIQDRIPPPKQAKPIPTEHRHVFCIRRGDSYLIEQRPTTGRWAGMWQFITVIANGDAPTTKHVFASTGVKIESIDSLLTVHHALTHRRYHFNAFTCVARTRPAAPEPRRWATLDQMHDLPFSKPQLAIRNALAENNK